MENCYPFMSPLSQQGMENCYPFMQTTINYWASLNGAQGNCDTSEVLEVGIALRIGDVWTVDVLRTAERLDIC
jgi:hypothetical protein